MTWIRPWRWRCAPVWTCTTELDQVQDAARKIDVAANVLLPALDFSFVADVPDSPSNTLGELDFENAVYTAGLNLELPLDTKAQPQ